MGSATPDGQCLVAVKILIWLYYRVRSLPVVIVGLAHAAGGSGDSVDGSLSGGCSGRLSDTSGAVPVSRSALFYL